MLYGVCAIVVCHLATQVEVPVPSPQAHEHVEQGIAFLDGNDFEAAIETLAGIQGGLSFEDAVRREESLGVALAYSDQPEAAAKVFARLLAIQPGHVLPYSISPKATFVFERVRRKMSSERNTDLHLEMPSSVAYDEPIPVSMTWTAMSLDLLSTYYLCYRLKGSEQDYRCLRFEQPQLNIKTQLQLPPISRQQAAGLVDTENQGVLMLVAVLGFDRDDNEVFRGPSREQPRELLVGVAPPAPWYASPWLWGASGLALAAAVSGGIAAAIILQPQTILITAEVR